ncbi:hypothetical protein CGZ92_10405 [Parenemella sanctibonifatiensis]|uniref:DUF7224 domain-containing protein n=1 Tax=Parenemella sanctibonifatiensis TaxID=2016505 RepID=A0A255E0Y1_9ACTN|nr:hypothetical protein CGZ92_10405 [Parenemella sanctibonifatiensis]
MWVLTPGLLPWHSAPVWSSGVFGIASASLMMSPLLAAGAAWQMHRLKVAGAWTAPHVRPRIVIALAPLIPAVVSALAASLALWLVVGPQLSGSPTPWERASAIALLPLLLLANTAVGAVLGALLRPVVALPVSAIGVWAVAAYPISMMPFNWRHMAGIHMSCCSINDAVAPAAVIGPVLATCAVLAAALLILAGGPGRRLPLGIGAAVAVSGLASSWFVVSDLGPDPVVDRPRSALVCVDSSRVEVCVWQQNASALPAAARAVDAVVRGLSDVNVSVPSVASEGRDPEWWFAVSADSDDEDRLHAVATGLVTPGRSPACADAGQPWLTATMHPALIAWVVLRAGGNPDRLAELVTPDVVAYAREKAALPAADQAEWFEANRRIAADCGVEPIW